MINRIYTLTDEDFIELIKGSSNVSEVLFKLGYSIKGNSWAFGLIKRRMSDLNLDITDFKGRSPKKLENEQKQVTDQELFRTNCKHNRNIIRRRIIKENLLPYKCAICGISSWNGKTLSLELDHINGINDDNRLENLRFLCPNCHSQTTTYGSRNHRIAESKYDITDELRELVINTYKKYGDIRVVSAKLGIRRKVVRRIVLEAELIRVSQTYVIRYNDKHQEMARYGSLTEAAKALIANNEVRTKKVDTCRHTISRHGNSWWLNSYWKLLDGKGIIHNPLLESSLIDSEDVIIDEAQAKAA